MKVSIIIPVKDAITVIEKGINSLLQQSCTDIEIICVDDNSIDGTAELLEQLKMKEKRIKVIHFEETRGALQARKAGVAVATGEYIMFLDADDYLEPDACNDLYLLVKREKVDILHFSAIVDDCGAGYERTCNMNEFIKPYTHKLKNEKVFEACFVDNLYKFNLWNKIIRTELCKEAFLDLEDGYFPKANDLYAYFMIALHAKSYIGVTTKAYYHYQFGKGSTGSRNMQFEQFEICCKEKYVVEALERFIEKNQQFQKYGDCVQQIKTKFTKECLWNWKEHLSHEAQLKGFDELVRVWGMPDVASCIAEKYHKIRGDIAESIVHASVLKPIEREIRTIGIFYFRIAKGGVQRVISLQIPIFLKLGYKVVLFTDEYDPENEYDLPKNIERVLLPNSFRISVSDYKKRAPELDKQLKQKEIDVILYHAGSSPMLFYDMLITKAQGIPFIVTIHELFSQGMVKLAPWQRQRVGIFRMLDQLIVLSRLEQTYWNILGISAKYVPNPIQDIQADHKMGEYVLWMGRLDKEQKQYEEAVHIMSLVVEILPETKMKMIGNEYSPNARNNIKKLIHKYGLDDNIELIDFQKDVKPIYEGARVQLVTSAYESFPMMIIESKSYGVPLVTYDMPYLELLKEKKGYFSVSQGDRKEAAKYIIQIMRDDSLCRQLSMEATESIKLFTEYDLDSKWNEIIQNIFSQKDNGIQCDYQESDIRMILESILFHYEKGANKYKNEIQKNDKIKKSKAYKLGNLLLKYPHKVYYWLQKKVR